MVNGKRRPYLPVPVHIEARVGGQEIRFFKIIWEIFLTKGNPDRNEGRLRHLLHRIPYQTFRQTSRIHGGGASGNKERPGQPILHSLSRSNAFLLIVTMMEMPRMAEARDPADPVKNFVKCLKCTVYQGYRNSPFLQLARKAGNSQRGKQFFGPGLCTGSRDRRSLTRVRARGFTGTHPLRFVVPYPG